MKPRLQSLGYVVLRKSRSHGLVRLRSVRRRHLCLHRLSLAVSPRPRWRPAPLALRDPGRSLSLAVFTDTPVEKARRPLLRRLRWRIGTRTSGLFRRKPILPLLQWDVVLPRTASGRLGEEEVESIQAVDPFSTSERKDQTLSEMRSASSTGFVLRSDVRHLLLPILQRLLEQSSRLAGPRALAQLVDLFFSGAGFDI